MRLSISFLLFSSALSAAPALAFPEYLAKRVSTNIQPRDASDDTPIQAAFRKRVAEIKSGEDVFPKIKRAIPRNENQQYPRTVFALINPESFPYNEQEQYVDLDSSEHEYQQPGPDDIRGPCPGLNLLANHGYLPRNGITTVAQGIDAINRVFGVEADLALALNAYATVFNGAVLDTTWSIGGPYTPTGLLGGIGGLLGGEPQGINAHNVYEGDASIVRRDYYEPGYNNDNVHLDLQLFRDLLALGGNDATAGKDVYTSDLMLKHKSNRWHESVASNPLFFNSPFGGLVVTTAAERFVAEFAANNTKGPDGNNFIYLDEPNLLAFFGVTKHADGSLTYQRGTERLLPSWHRRPLAAQFGLDDIVLTLLNAARTDPNLLSVGGNNGKVNSFTGVDAGNLTQGVFNVPDLLNNPAALACFLYQGFESVVPTFLGQVYTTINQALAYLTKSYNPAWQKATTADGNVCKAYNANLSAAYKKYPGSKKGSVQGSPAGKQ